jgi:putative pyruvate formate lyase activating enzyme
MRDPIQVAYRKLLSSGELAQRVQRAYQRLSSCDICPRKCGVNRIDGRREGVCRTGELAIVASYGAHFGEEDPLRGFRGSGTIFFARCNLQCLYCQNYDISQIGYGEPTTPEQLAAMMLDLQDQGCHNINLVSPSHVVPQILAGLLIAARAELNIPLVYNTGGYDALETLALLDGVVDIYMPDMKYADTAIGRRLSGIPDYPQVNRAALREMHRQVGDLQTDHRGIARRGLLVRHLVLPAGLAGTTDVVGFLASEVSTNTYLNLMDQYRPCYRAHQVSEFPDLGRRITSAEYAAALRAAGRVGLTRLDRRLQRIL